MGSVDTERGGPWLERPKPEVTVMERRILFAVDDDEMLPGALPVVAAYARTWGAGVRVLHVARVDAPAGASRRLVMAVVERLRAEGIAAEGEIRPLRRGRGEDVGEVVAEAAAHADLVVVGSRGRSEVGALLMGSVDQSAASRLEAPMLVLRATSAPSPAAEPRTVLVAVDGSAASDEAAAEAAAVAAGFGASVFVLHVMPLMRVASAGMVESEEEAQAILRRGVAAVEERHVRATGGLVADPSVAGAIATTADRLDAELVVLGSRRPSHLGGLVLGSVAHEVIHRLRRPVLLARHLRAAEAAR
jgi:nucleotide-binding universal stress UspA family protein